MLPLPTPVKNTILLFGAFFFGSLSNKMMAQSYEFNLSSSQRVCLVSCEVELNPPKVTLRFLDSMFHGASPLEVFRRQPGNLTWTRIASSIPGGTGHWEDQNVKTGEIWEYQVKRKNTWNFRGEDYDATGYTMGNLRSDLELAPKRMILLVADDVVDKLPDAYLQLKKDLTAESWLVNELIVPRAKNWDSGAEVVEIRERIRDIYLQAPGTLKPSVLFIVGHVPLPRCGSTEVIAPDDHNENKGARGCDAFYADIDGIFTDTATYNPGGLATPLAVNLPGDFKWDQDFFPSDIEMGFGRVDFADIAELIDDEFTLLGNYLNRLNQYRMVEPGYKMGQRSGFYFGYENSNDGSYRSLVNISGPDKVFQNKPGPNHNRWVKENGPFNFYMQNLLVPDLEDWKTYGMDATVFSSDQSYWGFGDVPQPGGVYSRIRALLGVPSKCLVTLWTTTGINIFHQACSGEALGSAMKNIMNHNPVNQYLEKPPQEYDTQDWWNRTHFAYYGDPAIRLYQVPPPDTVYIAENASGQGELHWTYTREDTIHAFQISRSNSAWGPFEHEVILSAGDTQWLITNYQPGIFYKVNAVKILTNGCGELLFPGIGQITLAAPILSSSNALKNKPSLVAVNPITSTFQVSSSEPIERILLYNGLGQLLLDKTMSPSNQWQEDATSYPSGTYYIKVLGQKASWSETLIAIKYKE